MQKKILVIGDSNISKHLVDTLDKDRGIIIVDNAKDIEDLVKFKAKEVKQRLELKPLDTLVAIDLPNPKHNQSWKKKHKRGY